MSRPPRNIAASVRQRLLNHARETGEDFQRVLDRYAVERFLYRLSLSQWSEQFLLKGAMLFLTWDEFPHRPTRDLDLLGFGSPEIVMIEEIFRKIIGTNVEDDGIVFDGSSVRAGAIREDALYDGIRIKVSGSLAGAQIALQIDVGFGDAVTPGPMPVLFPTLLDFPAPGLYAYPVETVVAEKFEAIVVLGMQNSRMKDFFDLWTIARSASLEGATAARAIRATFERRQTPVPTELPLGLSDEFALDAGKRIQWKAFLRKNRFDNVPDLEGVLALVRIFLMTPATAVNANRPFDLTWPPGGPWKTETP